MNDQVVIFHILKRQRPRRSSNWYLDRSPRAVETLCGADVTEYDQKFHRSAQPWIHTKTGRHFEPCATCVNLRAAAKASRSMAVTA